MQPVAHLASAVLVAAAVSSTALAQSTDRAPRAVLPSELAWVGLFDSGIVSWLHNEYRQDAICGPDRGFPEDLACRDSLMTPKVLVVPTHESPGATRTGEIVIIADAGEPIRAYVSTGTVTRLFTPDLYLADWGYGPPWFHMTVLDRRDEWFLVPLPALGPSWIDGGRLGSGGDGSPHVQIVGSAGDILRTPAGDAVVLAVENRTLVVRPEQDADMWCGEGAPPPVDPWQPVRIPFAALFDEEGRLLIAPKYLKGC